MTKKFAAIILNFTFLTLYVQVSTAQVKLKFTYFDSYEKISKIEYESVQDSMLNLQFFRDNYRIPYDFPKKLIEPKYKDQIVEAWNDTTEIKDWKYNWKYTFQYDSLSRVITYSYSSCSTCLEPPYQVHIMYDKQNRPDVFELRLVAEQKGPAQRKYVFSYNSQGKIIQIKYYQSGWLEEQIDRLE